MAQKTDKIYVFSVANVDFGRIVASVDRSGKKIDGENIFDVLELPRSESAKIKELIFGYGKCPYATACGRINKRVAFFFKNFAYDTSLCLVIVPAISAKRAAGIINSGVIEDLVVSETLSDTVSQNASERALAEDSDVYLYLARLFGQIMGLLELRLQYASESIPAVRAAAEGLAELLGLSLDFNTRFEMEDDLVAVDDLPQHRDGGVDVPFFNLREHTARYAGQFGGGIEGELLVLADGFGILGNCACDIHFFLQTY